AIIAILAILTAGGAYVPLDPTHPTDRINAVLTDCGARVVVDEAMVTACADGQDPGAPENVVDADNLAYVIYTSGSTGVPKGVLIEHRSVSAFIDGVQDLFSLSTADRFIQFASLGFDVSVFEIFGSLLSGARLYVVDDDERRSLDALDKVLVEQQITVIDLPPALMELLRRDRYLRGGDHISFLTQGYPACRFTEPHENYAHQHQDVRVENGVQFGDLPEFCDFAFTARVARVNAAVLWSLANAPGTPKNVRIDTSQLTNSTTLTWTRGTEPDLAGYEVVWRETTSS
ncbi:AMP-binding protein, partial [Kibdelosporangium lantanae]